MPRFHVGQHELNHAHAGEKVEFDGSFPVFAG
jgi:hypothetical protein